MGEKAFICTFCARSFGRLEHQKRHELIHVREKPFQCEHCSRGFTRRYEAWRGDFKRFEHSEPAT